MFYGTVPPQTLRTQGFPNVLDAASLPGPELLLERAHSLPPSPQPPRGWPSGFITQACPLPDFLLCLVLRVPALIAPPAQPGTILHPDSVLSFVPRTSLLNRRALRR